MILIKADFVTAAVTETDGQERKVTRQLVAQELRDRYMSSDMGTASDAQKFAWSEIGMNTLKAPLHEHSVQWAHLRICSLLN